MANEARQFLESANWDQDPLYVAYVLILVLGLRKGEVVGLPWSAVNLDRAELDIGGPRSTCILGSPYGSCALRCRTQHAGSAAAAGCRASLAPGGRGSQRLRRGRARRGLRAAASWRGSGRSSTIRFITMVEVSRCTPGKVASASSRSAA